MSKGNDIISRLTKLKDVNSPKDLHGLTAAMFPGTHCPLMGAEMAVRGIEDAMLFVIGTDECAYYVKHMTIHSDDFGGIGGRCVSAVLNTTDITFGSKKTVDIAVSEMMQEYSPKAVFVVSTCVVEVIGDDIESMADGYTEKYGIPFLAVHTEHFKCENHLPGVERTITACLELMEKQEKNNSVNIIGQRLGNFSDTELYSILKENSIDLGMQLPSGCTLDEIRTAPSAKINIVLNAIGLPLAKKMKAKFGTPYVFFDKFTDPKRILNAYEELFSSLEVEVPQKLYDMYNKCDTLLRESKAELKDTTYIYGNTPFNCMEFNSFMIDMGMKPLIIQTAKVDLVNDAEFIENIVENSDTYVTTVANIAPLQYVYDVIHPNLYLGHEFAVRLRKKDIEMVHSDRASGMLGFEVTEFILKELVRASIEAKKLKEEVNL